MKRQVANSPTRIDLAGGTLDIWPLNMLVDRAMTVNVAIDLWATCELEQVASASAGLDSSVLVRSEDQGVEERWPRASSPPDDTKLPLLAQCVRFFEPERGFKLTTRCASPAGAGLGGSSALTVSVLGALQSFLSRPMMPPDEMVSVARDLEARVLQVPTGTQDHFAATFGGAEAILYGPGRPVREALAVDMEQLGARLVLAYTGASRLSASANWDMVRRVIERDGQARAGLEAIAVIAREMRSALIQGDLDAAGELMDREWQERMRLSPKVSTGLIERCLENARAAGAIAGKVCGAGGGGCVAFLCKEGARGAVERSLANLGGDGVKILTARPTRMGLHLVG